MNQRIIFVIGTDTGVGKTVLTGLLLRHLRQQKVNVGVIKPFCSGGRDDAVKLADVLGRPDQLDEINPFHFNAPVTPLIAARVEGRVVPFRECLGLLAKAAAVSDTLLVEGAGGLLSPLGPGYSAINLIREMQPQTILVAPNRIGVLNHVFLNLTLLKQENRMPDTVVLMAQQAVDPSAETNAELLRETWPEVSVVELPFLGEEPLSKPVRQETETKLKKTLATWKSRP